MSVDPNLYSELESRGLVHQSTDTALAEYLKSPRVLYCGFDPTADTLHVGSLLPIITLRRFIRAGHKVIAVVGGATGMIGDPSFKAQERALMNEDTLRKNVRGIQATLSRFLDPKSVIFENNYDWMKRFSYLEFLRDIGKFFNVNQMIAKESVRARLEDRDQGISYTEFSYMLLQGYDFMHLYEAHQCTLQIGGSDQWGNITAGTELIRRKYAAEGRPAPQVYGLTQPLVTKADGTKFGKTEAGTLWLDPERTSPYAFYQFLFNTADADVIRYLHFFTDLPLSQIESLKKSVESEPHKREAQRTLAREVTSLVHGAEEVEHVEKAAQALFSESIRELDAKTLQSALSEAPATSIDSSRLKDGIAVIDLLVETGLAASKGAARKDLQGGGIYINNTRIADLEFKASTSDLIDGFGLVLRKGKKNYHLVKVKA